MQGIDVAAVALCAGLAGMAAHWAKGYFRDKRSHSFVDWFVRQNPKASASAVLCTIGAVVGTMTAGALPDSLAVASVQDLAPYFLAGYTIDSAVNKA